MLTLLIVESFHFTLQLPHVYYMMANVMIDQDNSQYSITIVDSMLEVCLEDGNGTACTFRALP